MPTPPMTVDDLAARLTTLEEQNRRTRGLLIGAVLIIGCLLACGSWSGVAGGNSVDGDAKILTVRQLNVVDENGKPRAILSTLPGYPALYMTDGSGKQRLTLKADGAGSSLVLLDQQGDVRAILGGDPEKGSVQLYGAKGWGNAFLSSAKGGSALQLTDGAEKRAIVIRVENQRSMVGIHDSRDRPRAAMMYSDEDGGKITVLDENGKILGPLP